MTPAIAVVGASAPPPDDAATAEEVGRALAEAGATVVCGGLGGVMEAACRGAKSVGGTTVGILPGSDRTAANAHVDVAIATGLGELRNGLIVRSVEGVVAVGGEHGTLSEIAFALKLGKPVVGVRTWELRRRDQPDPGIVVADDAAAAVATVLALAER